MKQFWTDEETGIAMQMLANKATNAEFIDRLGHNKRAAERRIQYVQSRHILKTVKPWSEEDTLTAIEMLEAKAHPDEFLRRLNRTICAAIQRAVYYKTSERIREMRAKRLPMTSLLTSRKAPPAHVAQEAARALTAPRSITGWICGDPLPGRSALDRRNAANAEARA